MRGGKAFPSGQIERAVVLWVFVALLSPVAWARYGGGAGTAEDPYLIYTAEQMNTIGLNSQDWDKHFLLMADIDLSAYQGDSFNLIGFHSGRSNLLGRPFTGVFDGNGHTIANFTYVIPDPDPQDAEEFVWRYGLFRFVSGEIRNLGLVYPNIAPAPESHYPKIQIGAMVGAVRWGRVSNCFVEGGWVRGVAHVGGLVGYVRGGTISGCYSTCDVSYCSGIFPACVDPIDGQGGFGGLVGRMVKGASVLDSYATGGVFGDRYNGGLVGQILTSDNTIRRCYATGEVAASPDSGGLVGWAWAEPGGVIADCFWDTTTTGQPASAGGEGRGTNEMQDMSLYLAAGWDFVGETINGPNDLWQMCCGQPMYPKLAWEDALTGDFLGREGVDAADLAVLAENWLNVVTTPCRKGDLNGDYWVNFVDLALLARSWRQGGRMTLYEAMLDTDPGWSRDGQWQFGSPAGLGGDEYGYPDPTAGYTGEHVFGVNRRGDYGLTIDGPHYLTAGPFDCRAGRDMRLQFARWLNTDQADFVEATVEVSRDGVSWAMVWAYANTEAELTENAWRVVTYDIGAIADGEPRVYIRWGYEVKDAGAWVFSGWNIDDIILWSNR